MGKAEYCFLKYIIRKFYKSATENVHIVGNYCLYSTIVPCFPLTFDCEMFVPPVCFLMNETCMILIDP